MKASAILTQALNILRTEGWIVREFQSRAGHCALGGIGAAQGANNQSDYYQYLQLPDSKAAAAVLVEAIPPDQRYRSSYTLDEHDRNCYIVATYNNMQINFKVIEAWFEKAIELAEAKEMYTELEAAPIPAPVMMTVVRDREEAVCV